MIEFLRMGGVPIWMVLGLGIATVTRAGLFVYRPSDNGVPVIRALSASTVFSILCATAAAFGAVMNHVPERYADQPNIHLIVMKGCGETVTAAIVGFALLTIAWFLLGIGVRRSNT